MQPYFLPYVGYFQLINNVDEFILLDDVNYINKGWIDRNKIKINNSDFYFKLQLEKKSQNQLIKDLNLIDDNKWKNKFLRTIKNNYSKSQNFDEVFTILKKIIFFNERNLVDYLENSLIEILNFLKIPKKLKRSSEILENNLLKGEDKIIGLCQKIGATEYINLPGGKNYYNKENFFKKNINLKFITPKFDEISNYSIIDLLFNNMEKINHDVKQFTIE
tara:strand:+ start:5738 stop:6394 length:657 start_codon:yes stop_codon:yes gene_type:complete